MMSSLQKIRFLSSKACRFDIQVPTKKTVAPDLFLIGREIGSKKMESGKERRHG